MKPFPITPLEAYDRKISVDGGKRLGLSAWLYTGSPGHPVAKKLFGSFDLDYLQKKNRLWVDVDLVCELQSLILPSS